MGFEPKTFQPVIWHTNQYTMGASDSWTLNDITEHDNGSFPSVLFSNNDTRTLNIASAYHDGSLCSVHFSSNDTWTLNIASAYHDGSLCSVHFSSNDTWTLNGPMSHHDGSLHSTSFSISDTWTFNITITAHYAESLPVHHAATMIPGHWMMPLHVMMAVCPLCLSATTPPGFTNHHAPRQPVPPWGREAEDGLHYSAGSSRWNTLLFCLSR